MRRKMFKAYLKGYLPLIVTVFPEAIYRGYILIAGKRKMRVTLSTAYFETKGEAQDWLEDKLQTEISELKRKLEFANSQLEELKERGEKWE